MLIPAPIQRLVDALSRLPGVGPKTASRLTFYLLRGDASRPVPHGLFLLEVNTQPGMTPLSLVPEQAAHCGIPFHELVGWMVENARCDG